MSMRTYGVETKGLVITQDELYKLILKNDNKLLRDILDVENIDSVDDYDVNDFAYSIDYTTWYSDIDGKLYSIDDWRELQYYNETSIIITELRKDNLYEKYNNFDEIKQELKDTYRQVGIELDDEFIEKHFGRFSGTYWG